MNEDKEKKTKQRFGDIYDNFVDGIYRFIFFKVGTQEVAQDLTSETFTKAWHAFRTRAMVRQAHHKKGDNSHGDIQNMQAFLYQIARNAIADYYRKEGRTQVVPAEEAVLASAQDPSGEDVEAQMAVSSDMERVRLALADLKDEYREHVIWYYIDELSAPEIAKITKRSEEAVRVTIHRALQALRERMDTDI